MPSCHIVLSADSKSFLDLGACLIIGGNADLKGISDGMSERMGRL